MSGVTVTGTVSGVGTNFSYVTGTNANLDPGIYALTNIPSNSSVTLTAVKSGYQFSLQTVITGRSTDYSSTSGNIGNANFQGQPETPPGIWTQKINSGGTGRERAVGFSIGSRGYIGTGYDGSYTLTKDFWEYDPALNTWTQKADFGGTAREFAVGFSIGSKGYIGTGYDGSIINKRLLGI